jgi:SAM-dependent methyltransferase
LASQEVHFTGERVIPGEVNQDLWNEHYSRYRFAAEFARGKRVLDVGCGAGYGTALLAETATEAIGFDVSIEAVEYAKAHYGQKATFLAGDAIRFPAEDHSFELVTAFEVIEHIAEYERLIAEAARVLADDGIFVVSTPNKVYYSETRREVGPNPYHVHEFELEEFGAVLRRSFQHVQVIAQNQQEAVVFGGATGGGTSYLSSEPPLETAQFFIALCGNRPLTAAPFTYVAEAGNLLREREHYIHLLQDELARAQADRLHLLEEHKRSGRELEKSNAWALSLDHELADARQKLLAEQERYAAGQRDAEEKAKWALDLDRQLQDKSTELANIVAQLDEAHRELVKRTEWAREQEALCSERTQWAQDQEKQLQAQATLVGELQGLVEERTAWALRLDAELNDHSSVGHMLRTELRALAERAADLAGSEANLERLSKKLKEENQELKEQLRRSTLIVEESRGHLAAVGVIADRLSHERELVRTSKWLRLGKLLHLGPRLAEDNPPV